MLKNIICRMGKTLFKYQKTKLPKPNSILLFKLGAIGDVLMTTPLIRALRKKYPKAKIDYLVGKWSEPVIENNKNLNNVITFNEDIFFKKNIKQMLALGKKLKNYDVVLILDRAWEINLYSRFFSSFTVGFDRHGEGFCNNLSAEYDDKKHDIDYYLDLGKMIGCSTKNKKLEIALSNKEKEFANKIWKKHKLRKVIALCPGGGKNPGQVVTLKRWPTGKYVLLADKLLKENYRIILLGGPSDKKLGKNFINKDVINLIGKCTLRESGAIMAKCNTIICNDSGPMHLASATAKKIISIFGPTDPKKLAPIGHISLYKNLKCQPCYQDGSFTNCAHHRCMRWITVEEVMKYVK